MEYPIVSLKYPIHESETGSFQELVRKKDVEFGQLSILTIAPRCERGGHYHTRKKEWFCCTQGRCMLELTDVRDYSMSNVVLIDIRKEFVLVGPHISHLLRNLDEDRVCEILIICNEEYDEADPDTAKFSRVEYE